MSTAFAPLVTLPAGTNFIGEVGGQARTSEQTAVANAAAIALITDTVGKLINSPYANRENYVSGTASATGSPGFIPWAGSIATFTIKSPPAVTNHFLSCMGYGT